MSAMRFILLFVLLHEILCQCPPGYSTLFQNNQLVTCSPQNVCSCASISPGFFCQYSSQNSQYVCCGVSSPQCSSSSAQINNGIIQNCQSSSDCASGYTCSSGTCCALPSTQCGSGGGGLQCANGQVLVNGACVSQVSIGSYCQSSAVCTGGAQCLNNYCQCGNGQQNLNGQCQGGNGNSGQCGQGSVLVNNQCVPQVSPGSQCTSTQQCLDNSICNGVCTCQNNLQQINGYCVAAPSGSCQASQVLINGICQTYSTLNGPCVGNGQCVGGAVCQNSFCQCSTNTQSVTLTSNGVQRGYCLSNSNSNFCQSGQVYVNGQCLQQIQLGGYGCQTTQQCLGNAICTSSQCLCGQGMSQQNGQCITGSGQCATNQVYVNGQCMQQIQLGSFGCSVSQQCLGSNAQCTNGQCQCPIGSTQQNGQCITSNGQCGTNQVYVNGQCMQQIQLGSFGCSVSQQCLGTNAQCTNGQCQCPIGSTQQNGQCITSNGQCGTNQVYVNGQCMQQIQLGSFGCSVSQQCLGNNAQCTNGQCQCPIGSTQQNGQCITGNGGVGCQLGSVMVNGVCTQMVPPGSSQCYASNQCLDNAICNFNTCACQNNGQSISGYCMPQSSGFCSSTQTYINGQCVTYSTVGGQCLADQQCLGGSNCLNGACACSANKQRFCTAQNGFQSCYCLSSSTGTNCQSGQVLVNGICLQQLQIGGFGCQTTAQCLGNAVCQNGICQCAPGTVQQGTQCITSSATSQMVAPGSFCSTSSQCLDSSICSFNNCTCQNGGTAMYGYCLPVKTDFCSSTQVMINNNCVTYSVIGGSCQGTDKQCLGGSFCNNGMCSCRQGVQQTCLGSSQCYCQQGGGSGSIPIGGFGCTTGTTSAQQCAGNAVCQSGQCLCPLGTVQQNSQCVTTGGSPCQSYQVQFNGQCLDRVSIGQQCVNQVQCPSTGNVICSGTCTCSSGFSYDGTSCTTSSTFCPQGTVSVSNTCRSLVALGQFCQSTAQCIGFGICTNQFCACPTGTTNINNACRSSTGSIQCNINQVLIGNQCYNMVALGQSCIANQQCQGNGTCLNSICQCPSGSTNYGNGVCTGASSDSGLCSAGETPQYSNNQLINCLISACPSSSYCVYNVQFSKYVCCRAQSTTLTCANPAFSVVYQNGSPLNCLLSQCPTNSICEFNSSRQGYVCCQSGSSSSSATCTGNYYTYSNGFPFVCTTDTACTTSTTSTTSYRYCRQAPGQTFNVCCDRS